MKMMKTIVVSIALLLLGITFVVLNPFSYVAIILGMLFVAGGILIWVVPIHFQEMSRSRRSVVSRKGTSRKRRRKQFQKKQRVVRQKP